MFHRDVVGAVIDMTIILTTVFFNIRDKIIIKLVCEKIQSGTEFNELRLPTTSSKVIQIPPESRVQISSQSFIQILPHSVAQI